MRKISHLLTVRVSEQQQQQQLRAMYVDVTTNPLRVVSPLCVWQELTTRKSHKANANTTTTNTHTYMPTYSIP